MLPHLCIYSFSVKNASSIIQLYPVVWTKWAVTDLKLN